jgi:hypothetical protein
MVDDASSLPALIQTIQAAADAGASQDWTIADACAEVVGKRDGRTHQIAVSLRPQRSDDWVEDRGHAGQMFEMFFEYAPQTVKMLRQALPFRWFTECWKAHNKDARTWPLPTLMEFLQQAAEEGTEIKDFRSLFANEHETDDAKTLKGIGKKLLEWQGLELAGFPKDKVRTFRDALKILKDAHGELSKAQIGAE